MSNQMDNDNLMIQLEDQYGVLLRTWKSREFHYRAVDSSGDCYYYKEKPEGKTGSEWIINTNWGGPGFVTGKGVAYGGRVSADWARENWENSLQTFGEYLEATNQIQS